MLCRVWCEVAMIDAYKRQDTVKMPLNTTCVLSGEYGRCFQLRRLLRRLALSAKPSMTSTANPASAQLRAAGGRLLMLLCCSFDFETFDALLSAFAGSAGSAGLAGRVLAGRGAADCAAVFSAAGEFAGRLLGRNSSERLCCHQPVPPNASPYPGAGMAAVPAIARLSCSAAAVISTAARRRCRQHRPQRWFRG